MRETLLPEQLQVIKDDSRRIGKLLLDSLGVVMLVNAQNSCNAESAQKILSSVPYVKFPFLMPDGHYTGETALSLCSFLRDMGSIDIE